MRQKGTATWILVLLCAPVGAGALTPTANFVVADFGFGASLAISGDGRRVVFESAANPTGGNADGNNELFLWEQTVGFTQLTATTGSTFYWQEDVDFDGTTIAVVAEADITASGATFTELYRWVEGSGWTQLTTTTGSSKVFIGSMGVDASGSRIMFTSRDDYAGQNAGGEEQVFLWDQANGFSQVTTATPCGGGGGNFGVDLSGDGTRILVNSRCDIGGGNPDLTGDLFLWDESDGFSQLTSGASEIGAAGTLTPSGSAAGLASNSNLVTSTPGAGFHLFRWREGAGFEQLTTQPTSFSNAPISADGQIIAFVAANDQGTGGNPEGADEIYLWRAGQIRALTDSGQADTSFGNSSPVMNNAGTRVAMVALRAFDAPNDNRTGYFVLDFAALSVLEIPALGSIGLIALSGLVGASAILALRRRRAG
jgi:hypothetical protein